MNKIIVKNLLFIKAEILVSENECISEIVDSRQQWSFFYRNICLGSALGGSSGVANGRYGKKFKLPVSPIPVNSRMHGSEEKRITLKEIWEIKNR